MRSRALIAVVSLAGAVVAPGPALAAVEYTTVASGLDGGGFMNVVAPNPYERGVVLGGTDVMGLFRSTDGAASWTPVSGDFASTIAGAASIAYTGTWTENGQQRYDTYAAMGPDDKGGLFRSVDGGRTSWRPTTDPASPATPRFNGGNGDQGAGHPRSIGRLIAFDQPAGQRPRFVYAATYRDGIMRSADEGSTWSVLPGTDVLPSPDPASIPTTLYWRSLVADPWDPTTLYAAALGAPTVFKITRADADPPAMTIQPMLGAAPNTEELSVVKFWKNGQKHLRIYAATSQGLYAYDSSDFQPQWTSVGGGGNWYTVTAYRAAGVDTVYLGSLVPEAAGNGGYRVVSTYTVSAGRSVTAGNWTELTTNRSVISNRLNGTGADWWLSANYNDVVLGHDTQVGTVERDPYADRLYVAGHAGIFVRDETMGAPESIHWAPFVNGLAVTFNRVVATDPRHPERIYLANTDWTFLWSDDRGATVHRSRPSAGIVKSASVGYALAVEATADRSPGRIFIGTGNRFDSTTPGGGVWSHGPFDDPGGWCNEGSPGSGGRVVGLAVGRDGGSTVLIAVVDGVGIFRKVRTTCTTEGWPATPVSAGASTLFLRAPVSWSDGSPRIFVGGSDGIRTSGDAGLTWTAVSGAPPTNYLGQDPAEPGRLFVVGGGFSWRIDAAHTGAPAVTKLGAAAGGSPLVASGDLLEVALPVGSARQRIARMPLAEARLRVKCTKPLLHEDCGFTSVTDDAYGAYQGRPHQIAAGCDGYRYVSMNGNGVIVLRPSVSSSC